MRRLNMRRVRVLAMTSRVVAQRKKGTLPEVSGMGIEGSSRKRPGSGAYQLRADPFFRAVPGEIVLDRVEIRSCLSDGDLKAIPLGPPPVRRKDCRDVAVADRLAGGHEEQREQVRVGGEHILVRFDEPLSEVGPQQLRITGAVGPRPRA